MTQASALTGTALSWIREDLDKQMNKVRLQVENIARNPLAGGAALAAANDDILQLKLTFETLVLNGAEQVMEEMYRLCSQLLEDENADRQQALEALMDGLVVLPAYLDRLQSGHQDIPVVLLPLINKLRSAHGEEELTEGTLFAPLLDVELPELEFVRRPGYNEPFEYFSKRMERQFESALLAWQQDQEDLSLLSALQGICETMRHRLKRYDLKRLWWVATEVVGGLMDGNAHNDVNLRRLLARLHLILQNILEGGEDAVDTATTTSVTQALLFHVAQARPGCRGLDLVRERFELDRLMPDREALMRAEGTLSGRDREMYESLSVAVQDELSLIKDALDLELRTGRVESDRREQSIEALNRLADTLRILGLVPAAESINEQLEAFEASADSSREEREALLVLLAERLLLVESALNEQIETLGDPLEEDPGTSFIDLPRHEQNRIRTRVLDEAVISVHMSEDAVRKRFSGDDAADPGTDLEEVWGALDLIDEEDVAVLSAELRDTVREKLHRVYAESGIPRHDLEALTDAMAALELFLAAKRDQQGNCSRFVNILRDRLETLSQERNTVVEMNPAPEEAGVAVEEASETQASQTYTAAEDPGQVDEPMDTPVPADSSTTTAPPVDTLADELPSTMDPELREIFLEEYEEVLESLQIAIPEWMASLDNVDALSRIRRAFHTLKGSGRMVGADELGDFSWQVEDMLNGLLEGRVENFADISIMVRLAQASLPALRQRLMQQPAGLSRGVINLIGQQAQGLGQGHSADWDALKDLLPAYLAGMLPGAIIPELGEPATATQDEAEGLLLQELRQNLKPIQEMLELISRDRGTVVTPEQVLAMHTIAGALAIKPEGRDDEIAKGLEATLHAQSSSARHFTNDSIWTMVSAVSHIQSRLDRLKGQAETAAPGDQGEIIDQLATLAEQLQSADAVAQEPVTGELDEPAIDEALREELAAEEPEFERDEELAEEPLAMEPPEEEQLDPDILAIFLEEAREVLERSDALLNEWRGDLLQLSLVQNLQREIHTFKGGARMAGLKVLGEFSHSMENLLERIAEQQLAPSVSAVQVLEDSCDRLQGWVDVVADGRVPDAGQALDLLLQQIQALEDVTSVPEIAPTPEPPAADEKTVHEMPDAPEPEPELVPGPGPTPEPRKKDGKAEAQQIKVASELLDSLVNAAGEVSIFRSRLDQQVGHLRSNMGEFDETMTRLREQFRKLDIEIETQIRSNYQTNTGDGAFDPLELDEFSTLHQLSRGLSETVSDLLNLQEMVEDNARKSEQLLLQQSRVSTELQEGLMKTRMVPFGSIATRLRRLVRGASKEMAKKARLELRMVGSSDELDRNVLSAITAPLEHMLRNSIVHGIEKPDARTGAGKDAEGEIAVTVESEATEFVIRIEDDGAGINLDAIRKRAVERGLLDPDVEPPRQQLYEFMMDSGFSTSSEVTKLAGRGVGMDVVSSEIKQIGGSLEIDSTPGQGTLFTIRIPFTLAVMQAIGVLAGKNRYLLPLASVVGVSRMLPDDYENLMAGESPIYAFAGQEYPVLDLEALLGEPARPLGRDNVSLLILNAGDQKAALRVPELLPHREVVIKPVGPQVSCVQGILGGSISADGDVVVILDPGPLIRHALLHGVSPAAPAAESFALPSHRLAMVVDDSITMRKVTSRVLEGHDFEVITARDGVDALEQLHDRTPDIMLFDIEMPRMDGYELTENVREDARLRDIPVIMITSRAGQKHRDRAKQAGANAYLTKPYTESDLIDEVNRLLSKDSD